MTVAIACSSFPDARTAARRFVLALALSAGIHLLLAGDIVLEGAQPAVRFAPSGVLSVRIEPLPPAPGVDGAADPRPAALPGGRGRDSGKVPRAEASANRETKLALALPQAPDPTDYSARDLDFYPRLAAPLELGRFGDGAENGAATGFRFELLIDERGAVSEISAMEGEPLQLREELRAILAATRFLPGRKDGRPVRSRVTLSIGLDASRRGSADR